jgi:hypothetical protein
MHPENPTPAGLLIPLSGQQCNEATTESSSDNQELVAEVGHLVQRQKVGGKAAQAGAAL